MDKNFEQANIFGLGQENTGYAQYFSDASFLNPLTDPTKTVFLANVTFEPDCRNNWHIHHAKSGGGQILICTAGEGWYQEEGKAVVSLVPGTVITIPAGIKHWHGSKYGKTTAQVMLLWHIQRGVVVIPEKSAFFSHYDPAMVEWFVKMVEERKNNHDSSKEKKNW